MGRLAFISGVEGVELLPAERDFFAQSKPLGLILFARNLVSAEQIKRLINDVRDAVGEEQFWVLIDQEGGRVQRLLPPLFPRLPAARRYTELYEKDRRKAQLAAYEIGKLMGHRLLELGINVNCTPVLDAAQPGAHDIIGDRSFGTDVEVIVALARRQAQGHLAAGVLPVIKHIPGHGRADADSHLSLPVVGAGIDQLRAVDFEPFRHLNAMPLAMTAHVIYSAIDPNKAASISWRLINDYIRAEIGFEGFLMCDDVSMQALDGSIGERTSAVMSAGCDGALHCNGKLSEMIEVAENSPVLEGLREYRFMNSFEMIANKLTVDEADALALLEEEWCGLTE